MVTLHDATKTIQKGIFLFFKKEQKPVSFKKKQKNPGLSQPWSS